MAVATSTALAVGALALAAAGTGVAVYGQAQQAKTAKAVGKYNAELAENQAAQVEMDAREALKRKRDQARQFAAIQRSRIAKAGVAEEGTPLEILAETAGELELDALAFSRATGIQADSLRGDARLSRYMGANAASAAKIGMGASLLSGASQMAGMGYQYRREGAI